MDWPCWLELIFENERRILVNEERNEVFRGHLEECLRNLGTSLASSVPRGSREAAQAKKPVADFCGVTIGSITRWLRDTGSFPIGEPLIKLMCYLDMVGYRVIELERIPRIRRNFAELIGYGLLTSDQAAEFLGYASMSTFYQVLQGHHGASEDKEQKMWDVWKERKEELQQKKERSQELYRLDIPLKIRSRVDVSKVLERQVSASRSKAVVSIMEGLLMLLEESSFEKFSDGDLADLKASADTILRLSAHLSSLSSRLIMSEQQRKGGS
ncbi:MAG: hypothetical protein UV76_C0007G0053 [Candidatus Nomurabacteria bacterium GW2011_GWA2_43_15]|uniref:Uncharacterized protein n=1 Tax=Candidatus Nomurabacteria bacterium GW2011_GWA2_43_15 TaxID=1618738 RepID=A0A0G1DT85_9BACT|nr:MAG: hypothetical protein UV76_C0007G0053 [Candidatus Nomurabacteria bacterium GW2011_GWA2_43_15]